MANVQNLTVAKALDDVELTSIPVADVARQLGLARTHLLKLIEQGEVKAVKGGTHMLPADRDALALTLTAARARFRQRCAATVANRQALIAEHAHTR